MNMEARIGQRRSWTAVVVGVMTLASAPAFAQERTAVGADLPPAIAFAGGVPMPGGWSDGYIYADGARLHSYRATPAPG